MHLCFIFYNPTDLHLPTCRLQNFLRIENRTIISLDTATFVQEGQIWHKSLENNPKKYVFQIFFQPADRLENVKLGKNIWFFNLI